MGAVIIVCICLACFAVATAIWVEDAFFDN